MKKLDYFLNEANRPINLSDLKKLTISKDGKTTVHTSENGKTVKEVRDEKSIDLENSKDDDLDIAKNKPEPSKDKKKKEVDKTEKEDN